MWFVLSFRAGLGRLYYTHYFLFYIFIISKSLPSVISSFLGTVFEREKGTFIFFVIWPRPLNRGGH